ncbi:MAG: imidazole glycerol phosphate synthase subunit HisF [Euryarchaeota archaeon]|nr:imidazole glycerol phosphate synthase subunit HisF [Euryarchaeota archaeon]
MLTKRIIACLDILSGRVVKGIHFQQLRLAGDPPALAKVYDKDGADEIVFLDIGASPEGRKIMLDVVRRTADQVFVPLTVGGGLRSIKDIQEVLRAGADKVSVNTAAIQNPKIIEEGAKKFGSQCIVIAIDAKMVKPQKWEAYIYGGRQSTGIDAVEWAKKVEKLGAGEILLTSMDKDGTQEGYDISLTKTICDSVNIPVIASGGAGTIDHVYQVLTETKADAALVASVVHYGKYTVKQIKETLKTKGVPVRI